MSSLPTVDDLLIRAAAAGDVGAQQTLARRDEAARAAADEAIEGRVEAALAPVTEVLNRLGIGLGAIAGILRIPGMADQPAAQLPETPAEPVVAEPETVAEPAAAPETPAQPVVAAEETAEQPVAEEGQVLSIEAEDLDDEAAGHAAEEALPEDAPPVDPGTGAPVGEPPAEEVTDDLPAVPDAPEAPATAEPGDLPGHEGGE